MSKTSRQCVYTCVSFGLHATHTLAHGHKGEVVFLQTLIGLLIEAGKGAELTPVKALLRNVVDDTERGHHAVEIRLLATSPSAPHTEGRNRREAGKRVR